MNQTFYKHLQKFNDILYIFVMFELLNSQEEFSNLAEKNL